MNRIPIFYWNAKSIIPGRTKNWVFGRAWKHGNFGDLFNIDLARHFFKLDPVNVPIGIYRRLFMVGSTLHFANHRDIVMGAGLRSERPSVSLNPDTIFGLRGELSRKHLLDQHSKLPNLEFLMDPGILASEVYRHLDFGREEKYDNLFIPHYEDLPEWSIMAGSGAKLLSPDNQPETIFGEILKSKLVITSSLHGLIFSHSAGIPAALVRTSKQPELKYRDYESTLNRKLTVFDSVDDALRFRGSLEPCEPRITISETQKVFSELAQSSLSGMR